VKITIAIPNFNGQELLQKNLPNILESGADEVLIIDDCSKDKSLEVLSDFLAKHSKLIIIKHEKNKGFLSTVNELFEKALGEIVVLLNNDVFVEKDFLKPLVPHFQNKKVFAVNLHEKGEGPSVAFWKDGFFEFKRGQEKEVVQKSAWASGGSAAFRKSIWKELDGFDKLLAPFYWEDTDISFRALKRGYEILWEPNSNVTHEHQTTISKVHKKRYISMVQQRNQLLFIWKNISDRKLKKEHKRGLLRRLLSSGFGYLVVLGWALLKRKTQKTLGIRSDLEVINYASQPTVSIVIVSYNSEDFIGKCITSVLKHLPIDGEVIVLDNASTDETVKVLEKFGSKIKLIKSKENLGFGRGNNRAVKEASGDYLFLLNPDTELKSNSFNELINFYETTENVGIMAPKLVLENGEIQESVKKSPSLIGAFKEYIIGVKNAYQQYAPTSKEPIEVDMIYGAAWLIKKDLFNELYGFDERFFMYYEDADFCKRLRRKGFKIYYYPGVSIKHLVGGTKSNQDKYKLNLDSAKKYHGTIGAFILQIIFLSGRVISRLRRR
jgi:GT2 family glycosyltransferase